MYATLYSTLKSYLIPILYLILTSHFELMKEVRHAD